MVKGGPREVRRRKENSLDVYNGRGVTLPHYVSFQISAIDRAKVRPARRRDSFSRTALKVSQRLFTTMQRFNLLYNVISRELPTKSYIAAKSAVSGPSARALLGPCSRQTKPLYSANAALYYVANSRMQLRI